MSEEGFEKWWMTEQASIANLPMPYKKEDVLLGWLAATTRVKDEVDLLNSENARLASEHQITHKWNAELCKEHLILKARVERLEGALRSIESWGCDPWIAKISREALGGTK